MRRSRLFLTFLVLTGLGCGSTGAVLQDFDGDGSLDSDDCGPSDASVYPGADDPYDDGIDQDCDGADGIDKDGDGYPANEDLSDLGLYDCDDNNPDVNPGADEIPGNGVDEDCNGSDEVDLDADGTPDELDCDPLDATLNHHDSDGDGYSTCDEDCDDSNASVFPDADEACDGLDTDCEGTVPGDEVDVDEDTYFACNDCDDADPSVYGIDADDDGFSPCTGDCDESNSLIYPGTGDVPGDGVDQNCDQVDGNDSDGDGFSAEVEPVDCDDTDPNLLGVSVDGDCDGSLTAEDCDDADPLRVPGSLELCDGVDNDCDVTTSAVGGEIDADNDTVLSCLDCDDDPATGSNRFPGNVEICDGQDNNCDSSVDEAFDLDGDGYFDVAEVACQLFYGALADCDDDDGAAFPGASEVLDDGIDQDCNGSDLVTCQGHYWLDPIISAVDLAELANCGQITGDLDITGVLPSIYLDALSSLVAVGGHLQVAETNLIDLSILESLTTVDGWFVIDGNPFLLNLDGLESLTSVGLDLLVENNTALANVDGLSSLTHVGLLSSPGTSEGIFFEGNTVLADISGLSSLTYLGGSLFLPDHAGITNLDDLSSLTEVGGTLAIYNPFISSLSGLANLTAVGTLELVGHTAITSLAGLHNLQSVAGDLYISSMDGLTHLNELASLTSVGGDLDVLYNSLLTDISGLSNLATVGGDASFEGNLELCESSVAAFLLTSSITGSTSNTANDDGC